MNLFRFAGDMSHVVSIIVLILRLRVSKSAVGISIKTQELFLIVFVTRHSRRVCWNCTLLRRLVSLALVA